MALIDILIVLLRFGWRTSVTQVGNYPVALAWSPQSRAILSANSLASNVSVMNDSTNRVVLSLPVGLGPDGLAWNNLTGSVYVANYESNDLSVLTPAPFSVTFEETGLPSGTWWSVTLNGTTANSNQSTITFDEPNGTFGFIVGSAGGHTPGPQSGEVRVEGTNPPPIAVWFASGSVSDLPLWAYVLVGLVVAVVTVGVVSIKVKQGRRPPGGPG